MDIKSIPNIIMEEQQDKKNNIPLSSEPTKTHKLHDNWTLWAHLPHDIDWSVNSYKKIITLFDIESSITVFETLPEKMISNCMLFLMRNNILPMWEDASNVNGGCFSYKVSNKCVSGVWKKLAYSLIGETLTNDKKLRPNINGITISPKKNFCIIKVWISNRENQNPASICTIDGGITPVGCIFKKHN